MRARVLPALVGCAALVGCGDTDANRRADRSAKQMSRATPTPSSPVSGYRARFDAVCRRSIAETAEVKRDVDRTIARRETLTEDDSFAALRATAADTRRVLRRQYQALERIEVPADAQPATALYVRRVRELAGLTDELLEALDARNVPELDRLVSGTEVITARERSAGRRAGFRDCGRGP